MGTDDIVTITLPLTEELFVAVVLPRLTENYARNAAEYIAMHPEASTVSVTYRGKQVIAVEFPYNNKDSN